jgi:DNA-binding MarR family transcriptional regulator
VANPDQRRAVEAVRALARAARVLERASDELSLAHYRVLAAVASGEQRASRVAARLALGKPTVIAAVESLCERGLLVRASVAGDQRAAALRLTADGEALLARVEREMVRRIEDLCAHAPDPAQLLSSLVALGAALDVARSSRPAAGR